MALAFLSDSQSRVPSCPDTKLDMGKHTTTLGAPANPIRLQHLNPIPIRILDKRQAFHLALIRLLDKRHPQFLKARRRLHIGHRNANVPKPLRFAVPVVVAQRRIILTAPVVGQLQQRFTAEGISRALTRVTGHLAGISSTCEPLGFNRSLQHSVFTSNLWS